MHHDPETFEQVRRVMLPSGRTIEIIYLGTPEADVAEPPSHEDSASAVAEAAEDLTRCGVCDCRFVQPVDWEEVGNTHWRITLRCPNCEEFGTVVVEDTVIDEYDIVLERGAAELARSLHAAVEAYIEAEVERLAGALQSGLLLPEDF